MNIEGLDGPGGMRLRPLQPGDLATLLEVLEDPSVARWWGRYDMTRVREEYSEADDTVALLVEIDGSVAGMIQYGEENDPDYRSASIDIALTAAFQRRGIGPQAIRVLARHLFEQRGHHRITIDPAVENGNAIRAYESVGFRRVGVMRQYERGLDGTWHDNLLMDMLAGELRE